MNDPILDNVRLIASELFDVPFARIGAGSAPSDFEAWDSVQHLNLMLALEEEFGVKFQPEDMENLKSIGQFADAVRNKVAV